jgi:hypothetical protein
MKQFFRRVSPRRAVTDFHEQWKQPTPHRWQILGVAVAATFAVFYSFVPDSTRVLPTRPEVIYISTWQEDRSDAEIIASNCANQQLKDELQARIDASNERRRELYKALGRATFIDVDELEEEIAEEPAAAAADAASEPTPEELALSVEEYCTRATG